jgi:hypothetical protein
MISISVAGDSTTLALSGENGVPSPPEGAFVMFRIGWLRERCRTDSRRKWMTDRTNNNNLNLSKCVRSLQTTGSMSRMRASWCWHQFEKKNVSGSCCTYKTTCNDKNLNLVPA